MVTRYGGTGTGSVAQWALKLITFVFRQRCWGMSPEDVEDAAMDVWAELWEKHPQLFDPVSDDLDQHRRWNYIVKAARSRCTDWVRRQYRQRRDPLDGAVSLDEPWRDN